jgi:antitoxin component of MazEF toxin-antitoxin module
MIKKITKIGNSQGIIFDNTIMELARLKTGDEVNLEIHAGGAITLMPTKQTTISEATASESAKRLIGKNSELFRRLS